MFLEHFGLSINPFGISPRLDFLYRSGAFEESMAHLVYGLDNSEAIIVITGAIGTGKTMAIQSFLSRLGDRYVSALVTNTSVDGKELLKLVLEDLDVSVPIGSDKSDLIISFKNFMLQTGAEGRRIVIVIDEAQNLSREVLEEIRLLTNLGQGDEQPVQIVLVGQPELDEALQRPDLAQLKQRVRVYYKLAPLSRRELEEYVNHRMAVAGGAVGVFGGPVLDLVYERSGGVPRLVNTLCGNALLSAFVAGRNKVNVTDLDESGPGHQPAPASHGGGFPASERLDARSAMAVRRPAGAAPAREAATVREPDADEVPARRGRTGLLVAASAVVVVAVVFLAVTGKLPFQGAEKPLPREAESVTVTPAVGTTVGDTAANAVVPVDVGAGVADSTAALPGVADGSVPPVPTMTPASRAPVVPETPAVVSAANTAGVKPAEVKPVAAKPAEVKPAGVKPVAPKAAAVEAAKTPATASNDFYIHISSFQTAEHAGDVAKRMEGTGAGTVVREHMVGDALWYRVLLGPFATHDDAVRKANELRDNGTVSYYQVIRLETGAGS
jgi:type II secretory pathway predicted ATPase ExeA/septal ring-binding cell division protein DamX